MKFLGHMVAHSFQRDHAVDTEERKVVQQKAMSHHPTTIVLANQIRVNAGSW